MRRYHLWKVLAASCLVMCVILVTKPQPEQSCPDPSDPYLQERASPLQEVRLFDVQKDALNMLQIPYKHLLGSPPTTKKFLSIGISSVKRKKENYLMSTLQSIFSHSSSAELGELVVVVYLANAKYSVNAEVADDIDKHFPSEIAAGRLVVISSFSNAYPPLEGLKRNYGDPPDRVKFRSKQNVDYAFLVNFCANLSQFYLMLEDDVTCSRNFLSSIRTYVQSYRSSWTTITFSTLGYIGKLYHSEDLPKLARFLLIFYDQMPCDWLLDLFYKSNAQKEMIRHKPSLFQHVGHFSSFRDSENNLKDKEFAEVVQAYGDHPQASCATSMTVYQQHTADHACFPSPSFFWGINIKADDHLTVTFQDPADIEKIGIVTGSAEHPGDTLKSGDVHLGRNKVKAHKHITCQSYTKIGAFHNGTFFLDNINQTTGGSIDCLKIQVSAPQAEWLIIQKVGIWVRKEKARPDNSSHIASAAG